MNFPGHRYLGPGNPVINGPPVDEDDRIAQLHDQAYERAGSDSDIRAADRIAIGRFASDFLTTGNWHSAVGAFGLGAKYLGESAVGVQYPSMSGKNTVGSGGPAGGAGADVDPLLEEEAGPSAKRARRAGAGNAEAMEAESGGESGKHGGMGHTLGSVHQPGTSFKRGTLVFTHTRLMTTCGYTYKGFESTRKLDGEKKQCLVSTPYAYVPCSTVPWYLTRTEFDNLPTTSSVKKAITTCTPLGYRTPFVTNSAGVNYVNSEFLIMGMSAFGLCNKYNGINCSLTSDSSCPMVPTGVAEADGMAPDHWYGPPAESKAIADEYIPCAFGMEQPLLAYYTQSYDMDDAGSRKYPTLPEIMNDLTLFPLVNNGVSDSIVWEYRPQICVLKPGKCYVPYRDKKGKFIVHFGQKPLYKYGLKPEITPLGKTMGLSSSSVDTGTGTYTVPYESYIEHVGGVSHGLCEYGGGLMPPSLHIGVLPVHSWLSTPVNDNVQPIVAIWKFSTQLEIEYSFDYTYPYDNFMHPVCATFGSDRFLKVNKNTSSFMGYRILLDN